MYEIWLHVQGSRSITVLVPCFFTEDHSVLLLQLDVPLADWLLMQLAGGRQGQSPPQPPPCVWADAHSTNVISVTRFLLPESSTTQLNKVVYTSTWLVVISCSVPALVYADQEHWKIP
jgi:hypothetical protein